MPSNSEQKDPGALIVPFGKHKGATVVEIIAADPPYVEWLMNQGWLAERFAAIHAAIASRGAISNDSPEHNALQVRFLDPDFRRAFLKLARPREVAQAAKDAISYWDCKNIVGLDAALDHLYSMEHQYVYTRDREPIEKAAAALALLKAASKDVLRPPVVISSNVKFEQKGVDVAIDWSAKTPDLPPYGQEEVTVELKPTMGDDFPSVMRQMERLGVSTVVAGSYCGTTVNESPVRQMFQANGYKLIFVHEIEQKATERSA